MSYQDAIQYLESFINYEKIPQYPYKDSFKLDRIKDFLQLLGNPQDSVKAIHVAGTKGKGSTCAMIAYILKAAGYKVGLYTSPHLMDFRERIRVLYNDGRETRDEGRTEFEGMITEDELVELVEYLKPYIEDFGRVSKWGNLSFFEVYTALAFEYFKRKNTDFIILETGLGGRLDATNVVYPVVAAITPIGMDHTDKLGSTIEEIAAEKSGIIKKACLIVTAPQQEAAMAVIENACGQNCAALYKIGDNITYSHRRTDEDCQKFGVSGINANYTELSIPLVGLHQIINAAVAIGVVELLSYKGIRIKEDAIREGLTCVRWPGRIDVVSRDPLVILDGAQTMESARALAHSIKSFFKYKKLTLVLGISKDKNIKGVCSELKGFADRIILTKASLPRAAEPATIAEFIGDKKFFITDTVEEAMEDALRRSQEGTLILATGSLFVVGEVKRYFLKRDRININAQI